MEHAYVHYKHTPLLIKWRDPLLLLSSHYIRQNITPLLPLAFNNIKYNLHHILSLSLDAKTRYTKKRPEHHKLRVRKRFSKAISHLLSCRTILQFHCSSCYYISDKIMTKFDVFGSSVEDMILRHRNCSLIVTINFCGTMLNLLQICNNSPHPNTSTNS